MAACSQCAGNMGRRNFIAVIASSLLLVFLSLIISVPGGPAWPQSGKSIRIIVPFPPGGSADVLARILGNQISQANGQTVIVDNRPGAGASIAYELAARAPPDGNTILIASNSVVINPFLKKTNYNALTSYEAICNLVSSPLIFVVSNASPYQTIGDLIAEARAKPGTLTLAALGPATTQHIAFEQFKLATKAEMIFVPYSGGAPAVNALLGEQVTSVLVNYSEAAEQIKAGKLRALATASRNRIKPLPDVPTVAESGYANYESEVWLGLLAPAKTSADDISQLAGWFVSAMKAPGVEAKLLALGLYPTALCGKDFSEFIRGKNEQYDRIIREANIKVQ
jgi:tripartite-type tricarboxylate transporter receptor subunit TctC